MNDSDTIRKLTITDDQQCSVTVKIYADGSVMLKQDEHQVYIPETLLSSLLAFLGSSLKPQRQG